MPPLDTPLHSQNVYIGETFEEPILTWNNHGNWRVKRKPKVAAAAWEFPVEASYRSLQ